MLYTAVYNNVVVVSFKFIINTVISIDIMYCQFFAISIGYGFTITSWRVSLHYTLYIIPSGRMYHRIALHYRPIARLYL